MADINDIARKLFPKAESIIVEALGDLPSVQVTGVVREIGEDGVARVDFLGDGVEGEEEDTLIEVPASAHLEEGDEVIVTLKGSSPIDATSIGWGDRVSTRVDAAETLAGEAKNIAEATNQHFWADGNGIHVSTDEGDPDGVNNILINSLGILLREYANVLLELSSAGVIVGDQSGTHLAIDSDSVDIMGLVNSVIALFMSLGYDATHAMAYLVSPRPIALQSNVGGGFYDSSTLAQTFIEANSTMQVAKLEATDGTYRAGVDANVTSGEPSASIGMTKGNKSASVTAMNGNVFIDCTSKIYTNMEAPIVYEDKTVTVTSTAHGTNFMTSVSVAKTGYTPIGVVDWWWDSGTRQNFFNAWGVFTSGDTLYVRLCNLHTSSNANGVLKARILYVKDELL